MPKTMKVKELIEILSKFDGNMDVQVQGGEWEHGDWAELSVGRMEVEEYTGQNGEPVVFNYFACEKVIMQEN